MNILEIASGAGVNGAIRHCLLLSRELIRRGHQVTLVCRPGAWIAEQLCDDPVEVIYSDLHRWPTDELRRMAGIIRSLGIDVVHTHQSRAHFFGVLLRWFSGVPCVATAQSRLFQLHWMFNDLVIAVSDATRQFHRRWNLVGRQRITTIHNFVDPEGLAAVPVATRNRMRAAFGADDSWNVIGTIGSVIPRKGLIYLVRALPTILATAPRTRLVVIGEDGPADYMRLLQGTAIQLGVSENIRWLGHRADVQNLVAGMDLCVLPSLEESLPLAILEAMAGGLPVVGTTVGGIPECVHPDKTGLLVPPADSEALSQAVLAILTDPTRRSRFRQAARVEVQDHFSPESQTIRIESALASVVRTPRSRAA